MNCFPCFIDKHQIILFIINYPSIHKVTCLIGSSSTTIILKAWYPHVTSLKDRFITGSIQRICKQFFCGQRMPHSEGASQIFFPIIVVALLRHSNRWHIFENIDIITMGQQHCQT